MILRSLAGVYLNSAAVPARGAREESVPANLEAQYRTLIEQIPAVVFMVYLDRGVGEAYVSPQIETILGFSRAEWLEDPIRWYESIHPDDKARWSDEAAEMFLSGGPLRSVYRVIARSGEVVSFRCEAKMVRRRRRPPLVHPRRGVRHHRPEARRRGSARGAQLRHCGGGYGRRSGPGARRGWANRARQSRV